MRKWMIGVAVVIMIGALSTWMLWHGHAQEGKVEPPARGNSHDLRESRDLPSGEVIEHSEPISSAASDDMSLIAALGSSDPRAKIEAANAISARSDEHLVQVLLAETSTVEERGIRLALLKSVETVDADKCAPALVKVLGIKKDGDIQKAAKTALVRSSSPVVVGTLIDYANTNSDDQYLVRDIGKTLASLNKTKAIESLASGLRSENITIFASCAAGLANIGDDSAKAALQSMVAATGDPLRKQILEEALSRISKRHMKP